MRSGTRTLLFAAADNDAILRKALAGQADAVVIDLEDAVHPQAKEAAREAARALLVDRTPSRMAVIVRINAPDTAEGIADLEALRAVPVDALMIPKASPRMMALLPESGHALIALVETAEGVEGAVAVASDSRVARLMLGSADLAADVGLELRPDETELLYARSRLAMASAAAGLEGPIDVVHLDVRDDVGLREASLRARSLGFRAKACIHPRQLDVVRDAFTPTSDALAKAQEIVDAFDAQEQVGAGVAMIGSRFIDLPVLRSARQVLAAGAPLSDPMTGAAR